MDSATLRANVSVLLGTLSLDMTDDIYNLAESIALSELGYAFPVTDSEKQSWLMRRCRRHIIDIFYTQAATSIEYKQSKHNLKFDHFKELIKSWDEEFNKAMSETPFVFSNISLTDSFGTYHRPGFVYDPFGNDITKYRK